MFALLLSVHVLTASQGSQDASPAAVAPVGEAAAAAAAAAAPTETNEGAAQTAPPPTIAAAPAAEPTAGSTPLKDALAAVRWLCTGISLGAALVALPTAVVTAFLMVASGVGLLADLSEGRNISVELGGFPARGSGAWWANTLTIAINLVPVVLLAVGVTLAFQLAGVGAGLVGSKLAGERGGPAQNEVGIK